MSTITRPQPDSQIEESPTTELNSESSKPFSVPDLIAPNNTQSDIPPTINVSTNQTPPNHFESQQHQSNILNKNLLKNISDSVAPLPSENQTKISSFHRNSTKKMKKISKPVTDSCWNWMVLMACTFSTTIMGSSYVLFALLYSDFVTSFDASTSSAGWIGSIHVGCVNLTGIPVGMLIERFGCRVIAVIGTLLCTCGFVLSAFATSINHLIVTYGVMAGCGLGMLTLSSVINTMRNFDKKRPIAGAIFSFGFSIGSVCIGPVLNIIFDHFSWRGGLIIYACFVLQMVVAATLFYRPQKQMEVWEECEDEENEKIGYKEEKEEEEEEDTLSPLINSQNVKIIPPPHIMPILTPLSKLSIFRNYLRSFRPLMDKKKKLYKSLLTDRPLVFHFIGSFWMYIGFQAFIQHTPNRALNLGIDRKLVSYLPTSNNGIGGVTKIIAGLIANIPGVNRNLFYSFSVLGLGLSQCLVALCHTFKMIVFQGILEGIFVGFTFSAIFVILVDLKGVENFPTTQPLLTLTYGFAALISTPLTGYFFDKTGDYDVTFLITSGFIILGSFFSFVSVVLLHKRNNKKSEEKLKKKKSLKKNSMCYSVSSVH